MSAEVLPRKSLTTLGLLAGPVTSTRPPPPSFYQRHNNERPSLLANPGPQKGTPKLYIAAALIIAIAGLVTQTESTAYYEDVLGWKKPFCSLYIMHSSLSLPWFLHLAYLRFKELDKPYTLWVRDYNNELRASVSTVEAFAVSGPSFVIKRAGSLGGPLDYLATTMGIVTVVLTVSGVSWFLSLVFTTPSDLTAIYNCSTFFCYGVQCAHLAPESRMGRHCCGGAVHHGYLYNRLWRYHF